MATDWTTANIYEKLFEVQRRVEHLSKNAYNDQQGFKFVPASQAISAIREVFNEVGILCTFSHDRQRAEQYTTSGGKQWWFTMLEATITFINVHNPNEKVTIGACGQGTDGSDKGIGKASTYGMKYAFFRQFLISTDEDDPERPSRHPQKDIDAVAGPPQGGSQQRGGQPPRQPSQPSQTPPVAPEQPPADDGAGYGVANPVSLPMVGRMLAIARTKNYQMKDLWAVITHHIADFNRPGNLKGDEFKEAIALQIEKVTYDAICTFLEAGNVVPEPGAQRPQEPGPEQYPTDTDDDIPF